MAPVLRTCFADLCCGQPARLSLGEASRLYVISVWPNDAANVAYRGRLWPHRPFLRFDHVEILVGRAGVEEHHLVFLAEETAGAQLPIGNERCGPFGRGEYALHAGPGSRGREDFIVGRSDRGALAFLEYLENQVIAISLGHAQSGGKGSGASPHFGSALSPLPRFHDRRATSSLHRDHFWALGTDPAQLLHLIEGLPHADHAHATAGRIDNALRQFPTQLFGNFVAHRLLTFDAERLFKSRDIEPSFFVLAFGNHAA